MSQWHCSGSEVAVSGVLSASGTMGAALPELFAFDYDWDEGIYMTMEMGIVQAYVYYMVEMAFMCWTRLNRE